MTATAATTTATAVATATATERQLQLEQECLTLGIEAYQRQISSGRLLPPHWRLIRLSVGKIIPVIQDFCKPKAGGRRAASIRKYLAMLPAETVAYVSVRSVLDMLQHGPKHLQGLFQSIGRAIEDSLDYQAYTKVDGGMKVRTTRKRLTYTAPAKKRATMLKFARETVEPIGWDATTRLHVGSKLVSIISEHTGILDQTYTVAQSGKKLKAAKLSPEVDKWLQDAHDACQAMAAKYLPCVIEPRHWAQGKRGGYYTQVGKLSMPVIKTRHKDLIAEIDRHDMPQVYEALNTLQDTAWRVNTDVLSVLNAVLQTEQRFGLLPPADLQATVLPLPCAEDEVETYKQRHPEAWAEWKKKRARTWDNFRTQQGLTYAAVATHAMAKRFQAEPAIYYTWNCCWRGRMYPVQPYLSPQGSDLGKGLLEFAEGKPLTESGVRWLRIHIANCWGEDKAPLSERIQWTLDHEALIRDTAENPLDGSREWTKADEPWQFLAACIDYTKWLDDPEHHLSHICVSVDGTCNGLQHYAAMLLDETGAQAVNVSPGETRRDIYSDVAEVVNQLIMDDKDNPLAACWAGHVDRALVKRGVMTIPYGVTRRGMADQIWEILKKTRAETGEYAFPIPDGMAGKACSYLADTILEGIGQMVGSAGTVMEWIRECAKVFVDAGLPIRWTTPVGFPAIQRYYQTTSTRVSTYWGTARLQLTMQQDNKKKLTRQKMINGLPPNVVHSLDAAHMVATILRCKKDHGITSFGMIHDSYGTHASDVETMQKVLRDCFAEMYSVNQLTILRNQWLEQLPEELRDRLPEPPQQGKLDIDTVRQSSYFFS